MGGAIRLRSMGGPSRTAWHSGAVSPGRWLNELARVADDPEVATRFERVWAERGPRD